MLRNKRRGVSHRWDGWHVKTYLSAVSQSQPYFNSFMHGFSEVPCALASMIDSGPTTG